MNILLQYSNYKRVFLFISPIMLFGIAFIIFSLDALMWGMYLIIISLILAFLSVERVIFTDEYLERSWLGPSINIKGFKNFHLNFREINKVLYKKTKIFVGWIFHDVHTLTLFTNSGKYVVGLNYFSENEKEKIKQIIKEKDIPFEEINE